MTTLAWKLFGAAVVLAAVLAVFYSWRSSLIEQGYQNAEADYKPKITKLEGQLAEWQASHERWEIAHATLVMAVNDSKAAMAKIDTESKAREARALAKADAARKEVERTKISAEALAVRIEQLQIPQEECDALRTVVDTARDGGL